MLITDDGQLTGAISGGCLEGDALQKSQMVILQQKSRIITYDTMDDSADTLGVGLGCNGIIRILIEPLQPGSANNQVEFLKKVVARRQKAVLVTLFSPEQSKESQPGTCIMLDESGVFHGSTGDYEFDEVLNTDAKEVMGSEKNAFKKYITREKPITAFIEIIKPAISLVVFGAGNDVIPLVNMADILGWEVTVIDGRSNYARPDRFEKACQVIVAKPEAVLDQIKTDEQTVFALMTHNYNYDIAMLKALIEKNTSYIGILGPKKKLERMIGELRSDGLDLPEHQLAKIYSPAGLDVGAETAEEIALSIIAEIKAVLSGGTGKSLRVRSGEIHSRSETIIQEKRLY